MLNEKLRFIKALTFIFEARTVFMDNKKPDNKYLFQDQILGDLALIGGLLSHELNNALSILKSASVQLGRIKSKEDFDIEKVSKVLNLLDISESKVGHISDNLKSYASPTDKLSEKQNVSFGSMLTEIFNHLLGFYGFQQELEFKVESEDDVLFENPLFLERVVYHILDNSLRANHKQKKKKIKVTLSGDESWYKIVFLDEGGGIKSDQLFNVTKPFFQLDQEYKHFGIGLSLVGYLCKHNHLKCKIQNYQSGLEISLEQILDPS
ncbi:MAG: hypothetical protein CL674_11435 [Bdellovibrionaceae bacterium]|nr:hypothetical protein [Pseudobdellovibrionaceae bacterium]|tara:strand:+ start:87115 stop:87909 length:795 start_codon:yes stop_codon:yes gene_type:complete